MSDRNEIMDNHYKQMLDKIGIILEQGRKQAYSAVNNVLIKTYWESGREIVEYEQKGKEKAEYGSALLDRISKDLKKRYGKGFSRRNVLDMRRFYLTYRKWQTVSAKLSWSHYTLLLSLSDNMAYLATTRTSRNQKGYNSPQSTQSTQRSILFFIINFFLLRDLCALCGEKNILPFSGKILI